MLLLTIWKSCFTCCFACNIGREAANLCPRNHLKFLSLKIYVVCHILYLQPVITTCNLFNTGFFSDGWCLSIFLETKYDGHGEKCYLKIIRRYNVIDDLLLIFHKKNTKL